MVRVTTFAMAVLWSALCSGQINGPKGPVGLGELVEVTADVGVGETVSFKPGVVEMTSGNVVDWTNNILPFRIYDQPKRKVFVFSAGLKASSVDLSIVRAKKVAGKKIERKVESITITIDNNLPPEPVPPGPEEPEEPDDPPPPPAPSSGVAAYVKKAFPKAATAKADAAKLVNAYQSIIVEITANRLSDPPKILTRTQDITEQAVGANRAAWEPFFAGLADEVLNPLQKAGGLKTAAELAKVYAEIVEALKAASG